MEHSIFISYNSCDIDVARIICDELKSQLSKSSFFFDVNILEVGEEYARKIVTSINNADVFICVIGEKTLSSSWQMNEVKLAVQKYQHDNCAIKIIPIILPNIDIKDYYENSLLKDFNFFNYSSCIVDRIAQIIADNENTKERFIDNNAKEEKLSSREDCCNNLKWPASKKSCLLLVGVLLAIALGGMYLASLTVSSQKPIVNGDAPDVDSDVLDTVCGIEDIDLYDSVACDSVACDTDMVSDSPNVNSDVQEEDISMYDYNNYENTTTEDLNIPNKIPNKNAEYEHTSEDKSAWIKYLLGFLFGLAISLIYVLYKQKRKKSILKVSANKNCAVSVDGKKNVILNKSEVGKIRLSVGKYIVDFVAEDQKSCKRYTSDIQQKGVDNAIICDFGEGENKERKIINVFIAGSTKLEAERNAIRAGISMIYNKWKSHNFAVFSYTFEDFSKTLDIDGQQSLYNKFIKEDANLAVFILDKKIGNKTREEFELAYNAYKKSGHPRILVYSKDDDVTTVDVSDVQQLMDGINNYWTTYIDTEHLRLSFMETLNWDLINLYQEELKK